MSAIIPQQKLLLLYLLGLCKFAMTGDQLTEYMVSNRWSDYFQLQQVLLELSEAGLIRRDEDFPYLVSITKEGRDALALFGLRIPLNLRHQMEMFVHVNRRRMRAESQLFAEYERDEKTGDVLVTLRAYEGASPRFSATVRVDSTGEAEKLAAAFRRRGDEAYSAFIEQMLEEETTQAAPAPKSNV
ncbi:MAG: DUF4364 family protein [Christensenellales bacterium]|jgi:hypothetical protein